MKNAIALLLALLVSFSFAQVTTTRTFDGNLYTLNTPSDFGRLHIVPHIFFESTVTASTDSRVISGGPAGNLQQNAIICEGDVTMDAAADADWAHDGDLYEYVDFVPTYDATTCNPAPYTRVSGNVPVEWNGDQYDTLFDHEICLENLPAPLGCWGQEGSLVNQHVDFYEIRPSFVIEDRLGQTNVVCKGITTLRAGTTMLSSSVIGDTPVGPSTMRLTRGTYAITNTMDVGGCLGVVRFPGCSGQEGAEKVFGRTSTSGSSGYTTSLQSTMNIRVVRDADLRCNAEAVSVTPSPVNVLPGGTQRITITVRNGCSATDPLCQPITVTGVTVSNGFRFNFDTGGGLVPIGYFTVNPGTAKTFNGILTAPAYTTCPAQLTFTAAYTCPGCTATISGTPATVNVPFDCPPPGGGQNLTDLVPRFTPDLPSRVDIETGNELDFSVITWNSGENSSNPGETCVNIGNWLTGLRIFDDLDGVSPIRYSYGAIPPGGAVVHEPISFSCTPAMENTTFLLIANVDCIPPINGTTPEGPAGESNNIATRWLSCMPPGNVTEGEGEHRCDLSPSFRTGFPLGIYSFHVTCPQDGNPDDTCSGSIEWASFSRNVTYTGSEDLDFYRITVGGGTLSGSVSIEANVRYDDGNATCSAELNVPTVPCEEFV